jgi:uncharacterized protein involved in exopolysaccharide biosynthesis
MDQSKEIQLNDDAINLKDLIKVFQAWFLVLRRNITLVTFFGLIGGGMGFYITFKSKPTYKAESKFLLKEGGASGLAGSLGSLGSLLGGSGGSTLDRAVAVIGTEKIIGKVLLTNWEINNQKDLVINHFIRLNPSADKWKEDTVLAVAQFRTIDTIPELFNFPQRKAYKAVMAALVGEKGFVGKSFDKKTGIVSLEVTFLDEDFAIEINELIYEQLKNFVRYQASETASLNTAVMIKKVDSIQGELNSVRRQLARKTDQSLGLLLNEEKVDLKSLAVKEQILLTMYGEAQKNLETVLFLSQSASNAANFTLLNRPFSPIKPIKKSKFLFTLVGFFLASFFTFFFIVIRRWYKNLMAS